MGTSVGGMSVGLSVGGGSVGGIGVGGTSVTVGGGTSVGGRVLVGRGVKVGVGRFRVGATVGSSRVRSSVQVGSINTVGVTGRGVIVLATEMIVADTVGVGLIVGVDSQICVGPIPNSALTVSAADVRMSLM